MSKSTVPGTVRCTKCDCVYDTSYSFCPNCGYGREETAGDATKTPGFGVPPPAFASTPATPPYTPPAQAPHVRQNSGKAVASLILAICGLFVPLICSALAIAFGVSARKEIEQSQGRLEGDGLALAGIVVGIVTLVIGMFFCFAIAVPVYMNSRSNAQRRTCQANQRTIDGAVQSYKANDPEGRFPDSLERMMEPDVRVLKSIPTCPSAGEYIWVYDPESGSPPYISCPDHSPM